MNIKHRLILISFMLCVISALLLNTGCGNSSSGGSRESSYCSKCEKLKKNIRSLEQKLNNVIAEKDRAITAQKNAEAKARSRYIVLSAIAYMALGIGIFLIGGFIVIIKNSKKNIPESMIEDLHCPRCGWEHGKEETVCKNCKTHF